MNIGFDLDKVFIDFPPFIPAVVIDKLYKKKSNGILLYRIPKKPEQVIRTLSHHPLLRPPIKDNLAFLKQIARKNDKIYLISSRFSFLKQRTNHIIQQHNFDDLFDGMYFNFEDKQPHEFKNDIVRKLQIDILVDDDLPLLRYIEKHNPKIKLFWLNKNTQAKISKQIYAITNLSQIFP